MLGLESSAFGMHACGVFISDILYDYFIYSGFLDSMNFVFQDNRAIGGIVLIGD